MRRFIGVLAVCTLALVSFLAGNAISGTRA